MPENNSSSKAEDSISAALAELDSLTQPSTIPPPFMEIKLAEYFYFLLSLWASFRVYQIEPFVEPREKGEDEAVIIKLKNGEEIYDYGYYLCASRKDYGTYCFGKLIESAKEMIHQLAKRGATLVSFSGHLILKRAAWIECLEQGIEVSNYMPTAEDWDLYDRIRLAKERIKQLAAERRPV